MTDRRRLYHTHANVLCLIGLVVVLFGEESRVFGSGTPAGAPRLANSRWGANYFPNVELTTHEGKTVRFFDDLLKDKVVVINFIYTACPDACPLETARLTEVHEILGDRVGHDIFFYSISIDPEVDTPEVLANYAKRYQTGAGWLFLTGDGDDITTLRRKLGLYIDEVNKDPNDHNLSMLIGNQRTGRWMKRSPFENPYILATEIGSWLHNYKNPSRNPNKYKDIPKLRNLTQGEGLFRTRCSVCHTIGQGDGLQRTGPNLLGVTDRRDRDWLERWLADPEAMLAEKDPIALGLFQAFNQVPMPNLKLNEHEISTLIEYLETESRRVAKVESVEALMDQKDAKVPECCQKKNLVLVKGKKSDADTAAMAPEKLPASNLSTAVTVLEKDPDSRQEPGTGPGNESPKPGDPRNPFKTALMLLGCVLGLLALAQKNREEQEPGQQGTGSS